MRSSCHHSHLVAIYWISNSDCTVYRIVVLSHIQVWWEVPCGSIVQDSLLHLQAIGVSVESLVVSYLRGLELNDNLFAARLISDVWNRAKFESPLGDLAFAIHAHHNSCSFIFGILIEECDLIHKVGFPVHKTLELWVAAGLPSTILNSENVSTTVLLVIFAEGRPVSQVNVEVEIVGIVFILESEVVTTHWIITVESQVVKLVLEEHNIITFSLNL